ncbi:MULTISPECIES: class I SAM-dependent methyltransferase [Brevibacterium]|uniref:Methyltransferase n=2 Tax=Brevibacterium TaxID=1696 RepID=A0ABP9U9G7_9MICO
MTDQTRELTDAQFAAAEALGARLYAAGYTEPYLRQFWGGPVSDALARNNSAPALHHCRRVLDERVREVLGAGGTAGIRVTADTGVTASDPQFPELSAEERLAAIAVTFWLKEALPAVVLAAALGDDSYAAARDLGLVEEVRPDGVNLRARAPFALTPYDLPVGVPRGLRPGDENLYLVADHGTLTSPEVLDGDFVLGLGGAGRTLVTLTPREHVSVACDIGTGCGIQALLLARHADRVIATDISARALHLTALSAGLAGVRTIELRQGSLLDPIDEPVDLLVSNPPFVITPRTTAAEAVIPDFEYRDGGMSGDRLVRELFAAVPGVLAPGGRAVCLGNWETTADSADGPEVWVEDPETSVLVIEREALDPVAYAETWIRDGGIPRASADWDAATAEWLDDFASRNVTGIVFGYVLLHRADNDSSSLSPAEAEPRPDARPAVRERVRITSATATNPHGISAFLTTVEALRTWLAATGDEEFATTAFTRSPDLVEHRHHVPGESDPSSITLEQGIGFGQVFDLDTALAGFVSVADGTLTLRQTAAALAQLLDVDPTALEAQLTAQVRTLVAAGALLPGDS